MKLRERSYSTQIFRPKPILWSGENPSSLVVLTPWGAGEDADRVLRLFQDQMQNDDLTDLTTPFGHIESLSTKGNQMRTAALLANDYLYKECNQAEFTSAIEALAINYENGLLSWVQIGAPHILLVQSHKVQPLAYQFDWSWQMNQEAPLPSRALGLETTVQLNCGSVRLKSKADLLLVARGGIPSPAFQLESLELVSLSRIFVNENPNIPFWLGHVELDV